MPAAGATGFFQLDAHGTYQPALPDADGIYHARAVPGFWLKVDWLWQEPLPDVEQLAREIAPVAYARDLAQRASDEDVRALLEQLRQAGRLPESGA